jgi:hypothetical protein
MNKLSKPAFWANCEIRGFVTRRTPIACKELRQFTNSGASGLRGNEIMGGAYLADLASCGAGMEGVLAERHDAVSCVCCSTEL